MIKLLADSTNDLSPDILEKYNIGVAPLNIYINGVTYRDKIDLTADDFFNMLPTLKELPTTAMPSPEAYLTLIDQAIQEGYTEFLCICMSSGTSGAYQSAELAKKLFYEQNPTSEIKIHIVDSLSMSHGSGWLILKTAQLLQEGWSYNELIAFVESHKRRVKHFLCVDDLKNLIKSGRLSNVGALMGSFLKIKPIMTMQDSKGAIVAKVRGRNKAMQYYIDQFTKRQDATLNNFIIIGYSSDKAYAQELRDRLLKQTAYPGQIYMMQMGVAVGTHVGLGGLSMFFMEKENMPLK